MCLESTAPTRRQAVKAKLLEKWLPSAGNVLASDNSLARVAGIAIYRLRGWM